MISAQPILLNCYISSKKYKNNNNVESNFYLSWEDALWDIVKSLKIRGESTILVPSFFCEDVLENMRNHGLVPHNYTVDINLQPIPVNLVSKIDEIKPSFIILFHAVGITNNCVHKSFIQSLPKDIIVIEDSVHRIIDPSTVQIYSRNHVVINSLRKVVPLQGSFLFGTSDFLKQLEGPQNTLIYSWMVIVLWMLMQFSLILQKYMPFKGLSKLFGTCAEIMMIKGYDIIGDSQKSGFCPLFFKNLYYKIDFLKVKNIKEEQVRLYERLLCISSNYSVPHLTLEDKKELRGYPIILSKVLAPHVIFQLRENNILVRAELDDSEWSKKRSIIYLPLGPHIEFQDISTIAKAFNNAISQI